MFADPAPNSSRFAFLNLAARDYYVEWDKDTQELVATMRGKAGRIPFDNRLTDRPGWRTVDALEAFPYALGGPRGVPSLQRGQEAAPPAGRQPRA